MAETDVGYLRYALDLDGSPPKRLIVRDTSPVGDVTRLYSVVADYDWAERILCSGSYRGDANGIASMVAAYLCIPVEVAEKRPAPVA